jgi:L-threonylcarbamoyladenylate synthase
MRINLNEAINRLQDGQIVAIPTETVYGLAGKLFNPNAIDQIYALKKRPNNNPLIIHVASLSQIHDFVEKLPDGFEQLANDFWPGPLTLIAPIIPETIPTAARAGLLTAAFRMPEHPLTLSLIKETGPLVAPSANLSGRPSATRPEHVEDDFGNAFPVLDGGACQRGMESTILINQNNTWKVIRLGSISPETLHPVLGYEPVVEKPTSSNTPLCPGQLYKHYAPNTRLYHVANDDGALNSHQTIIGFEEREYPDHAEVLLMGRLSDPLSVAENLYALFRQLDRDGIASAWIDTDFPDDGLWLTIRERILKASAS